MEITKKDSIYVTIIILILVSYVLIMSYEEDKYLDTEQYIFNSCFMGAIYGYEGGNLVNKEEFLKNTTRLHEITRFCDAMLETQLYKGEYNDK